MGWLILILSMAALTLPTARAQMPIEKLQDFRIDRLVRFRDSQQAEQARQRLIRAIWPGGLPATIPEATELSKQAPEMASIQAELWEEAYKLDVDVSNFDFHASVVLLTPRQKLSRLAIVHGGHMPEGAENYLGSGLSASAEQLLLDGWAVALVQMPLVGWNHDRDGVIDGRRFEIQARGTRGHDELFAAIEPQLKAGTMRLFLEPITQAINFFLASTSDSGRVIMIGLSGGGWTTHLYAAVDTRVERSIPVAGALPLYARPFSPGSKGDAEQEYPLIFAESDQDSDGIPETAAGIASWLEVFALGGIAMPGQAPRHQTQVINLYDSCCFSGEVYQSYAEPLAQMVSTIPGSGFSVYVDDTHRGHEISPHTIQQLIAPLSK